MLSPNVLSLLRSFDEVQSPELKPVQALLLAQHEQVVKAARFQASAAYGSVTSRKRHAAWKAAETKFVASLAQAFAVR